MCAFRCLRNVTRHLQERTFGGRLFQTVGAAVRNARVPNDKLHRVTDTRLAEADRRDLHGLCWWSKLEFNAPQINCQRLYSTSASMPAVLVAGTTATQNLPFLPQRWPKPPPILTTHTHKPGWVGLSDLKSTGMIDSSKVVTDRITNGAWLSSLENCCAWNCPSAVQINGRRITLAK